MSINAVDAYCRGLQPASKAASTWGFKSASALRACVPCSEWHHTSKRFNVTDFFHVRGTIRDLPWRELAAWKPHMRQRGWEMLKDDIRAKLRAQIISETPWRTPRKPRSARLRELDAKYPTPYQRHNGLPSLERAMDGKELTESNYLAAKAIIDARRAARNDETIRKTTHNEIV